MYCYRVGVYGYEDSRVFNLVSEIKYSKEEFENLYLQALRKSYFKVKEEYLSDPEWLKAFLDFTFTGTALDTLLEDIVECLIKDFGFKELEFTAGVRLWGYLPNNLETPPKTDLVKKVVEFLNEENEVFKKEVAEVLSKIPERET